MLESKNAPSGGQGGARDVLASRFASSFLIMPRVEKVVVDRIDMLRKLKRIAKLPEVRKAILASKINEMLKSHDKIDKANEIAAMLLNGARIVFAETASEISDVDIDDIKAISSDGIVKIVDTKTGRIVAKIVAGPARWTLGSDVDRYREIMAVLMSIIEDERYEDGAYVLSVRDIIDAWDRVVDGVDAEVRMEMMYMISGRPVCEHVIESLLREITGKKFDIKTDDCRIVYWGVIDE